MTDGSADFWEFAARYAPPEPPRAAWSPPADWTGLGAGTRYGLAALADECSRLAAMPPDSGRNNALNEACFSIRQLVDGGQLDGGHAWSEIERAAIASGLGRGEIGPTMRSGWNSAPAKAGPRAPAPRGDVAPAFVIDPNNRLVGNLAFAAETPTNGLAHEGSPLIGGSTNGRQNGCSDESGEGAATKGTDWAARLVDGARFVLDAPTEVPTLWGQGSRVLWPRGESLMIAGPMGLGKTTLGGLLMRALLADTPTQLLGLPVTPVPGARVLYLAMDRPVQAARAMARQFDETMRDALRERLTVWPGPPPADVAAQPALLAWLADLARADVVFLDSVKDAAAGLSEDDVAARYSRARQLLLQSGRELCELHHTTKRGHAGGAPTQVGDIYGSTWLTNGTGSILLLTGEPGDAIVGCRHVRQPLEEVGPLRLNHDQIAGEMSVAHGGDLTEALEDAGADGLTAAEAAVALFEYEAGQKPSRGRVEAARRRLDALVEAGAATTSAGGKGKGNMARWFAGGGTSFNG